MKDKVNISSGNGSLPDGTKPQPKPMLTKFSDAIPDNKGPWIDVC